MGTRDKVYVEVVGISFEKWFIENYLVCCSLLFWEKGYLICFIGPIKYGPVMCIILKYEIGTFLLNDVFCITLDGYLTPYPIS